MATEPQKLGKYNIVGKIGKGAMGDINKGHDPVLNRFVAIKIIAETLGTDSDLVERFKREARNAARLNHPNIITIYDFVEEEGHLYMVMELLEGQDLKELIKSGSPVTMDQILSIMEQIVTAWLRLLGNHPSRPEAREHPVSKNGQVKILDFGLVTRLRRHDQDRPGDGYPNYMSPEQVQGCESIPAPTSSPRRGVLRAPDRKKPSAPTRFTRRCSRSFRRPGASPVHHLPTPGEHGGPALDKDPRAASPATALRDHLRLLATVMRRTPSRRSPAARR
jgi:serine/threonine protein kinase